jgi:acyl-coenzyme A thioesterase PaaI-like protein
VPNTTSSTPSTPNARPNGTPQHAPVELSPSPAAERALSRPDNLDADENLDADRAGTEADDASSTANPSATDLGTTRVTIASRARKPGLVDRIEAFISRLSTRNNFWHRVCSLIWLPFAFRSGIKMKRLDDNTFNAVLPFRRFNRNWYNAMAGAALLGNAEIAGGMYVFGVCGGDYTVVCKHLEYKFLRPCFGPAVYRLAPRGDITALLAHGGEFNIVVDMDVFQGIAKAKLRKGEKATFTGGLGGREKRVGRCAATFHVTPKAHHKNKRERAAEPADEA